MPQFTIVTINSTFFTEARMPNLADADAGLAIGIRGAIMIAADEINGGATSSAVEVVVEDASGHQVRRSALSISTAPLAIGPVPQEPVPLPAHER